MARAPRILFAPASGAGVGGGHVMRGLALAAAVGRRGTECAFACGSAGAQIVARYGDGAFGVHVLAHPLAGLDPIAFAGWDAVVVDDYAVGAEIEARLHAIAPVVMAIDDLADRAHACDLILDPGHGRRTQDYAALAPAGTVVLAGPSYALLRPAFATAAVAASPRDTDGPIRRLFVSFGLSDVGGVAERVYAALRSRLATTQVDLALAHDAASLPALRQFTRTDANLRLHVDTAAVAALMTQADAAIGAGGASTWERACLALPSLAVVVADNQRGMIADLARDGALLSVSLDDPAFEASLVSAYDRLCVPEVRAHLTRKARALCDGQGAERAADALLGVMLSRR